MTPNTSIRFRRPTAYSVIYLVDVPKRELGDWAGWIIGIAESPDEQISLTDPDARSMATSARGSGVVGYNVQTARRRSVTTKR